MRNAELLTRFSVMCFTGSFYLPYSSVSAQAAGALPLSGATKEAKRSYALRSERTKNHRVVQIYPLVWDKRSATALFSVHSSVIFRFLLGASWQVFSHISALRLPLYIISATFIFHRVSSRLPRFAVSTLLPLTTRHSIVAD